MKIDDLITTEVVGRGVSIQGDDIDTDRIIPARFLKEITFDKMGEYLFYDARFDADHTRLDFPLNDPRFEGASILIVGKNFGCGSSREHAPQAIKRYGIQAIIGESFADIFAGNCKSLGIPCAQITEADREKLGQLVESNPLVRVRIDIKSTHIYCHEEAIPFTMSDECHQAFLSGTWDATMLLKANLDQVRATADRLPYLRFNS